MISTSAAQQVGAGSEIALSRRLVRSWHTLFRLAWPVILSRAGVLLMTMVSVVMVGRHDTVSLAQFSLGFAVFVPMLVVGIGCMVGIISVTARGHGAGDPDLPVIALRGLRWGALVGLFAAVPIFFAEPLLTVIGHRPDLAAGGGAVARMFALGATFQIIFSAASFYLEGTGRMKPGLVAMIVANVVNLGLNWMLIGGEFGSPELGAPGAALASTIARLVMTVGLVAWMLRLPEFAPWRARSLSFWGPGGWAAGSEMRRIGIAGGAAYFFESFAFASLAQAAGLIGTTALAAYTILHNIEASVFMIALGLSVATAVQVGQAMGSGNRAEAMLIGGAGLSAAMALIAVIGVSLLSGAGRVASFYSSDPVLIARAVPLFAILAVSMVFDAGQVVMGQATRALGDGWGTTLVFFISFWLVMIPVSLGLAFLTPLAEAGLFLGTAIGCATALALLGWRFRILLARPA